MNLIWIATHTSFGIILIAFDINIWFYKEKIY